MVAFYIYSFNSKVPCCLSAMGCSLSSCEHAPLRGGRIVWLHGRGQSLHAGVLSGSQQLRQLSPLQENIVGYNIPVPQAAIMTYCWKTEK